MVSEPKPKTTFSFFLKPSDTETAFFGGCGFGFNQKHKFQCTAIFRAFRPILIYFNNET